MRGRRPLILVEGLRAFGRDFAGTRQNLLVGERANFKGIHVPLSTRFSPRKYHHLKALAFLYQIHLAWSHQSL